MDIEVRGTQYYAYTGGKPFDPALPTIVLIHGAGLDHTTWMLQARYFAHHGCGVLAVDLPAHGRSRGEALADIGALADWLRALLAAAGVTTAAVIGHSMGAAIAIEYAARYPQHARAIGIVGAAVPMPVAPPLLEAARQNRHAAYDMITLWAHAYRAQIGRNPTPGMWMTGSTLRLLERNRPGVLFADFSACNDYVTGLDAARQVQCPALLVVGSADLMTPPRAIRDLLAALPDARTVALEGCGHMVMPEQPDALIDALRDFLRPLPAG
ncbi:MAG: alpha/beta hydrolase [Gammaproteobacteria bacterium]|nr:alpha/beta hydrolase [Gammaproteobacteria bacterium]